MRIEKAKVRMPVIKNDNDGDHKQRVSSYTESYKGEYYNIELDKLIPFKNQSRKHFDPQSLEDLASSIRAHGVRQPLTILPSAQQEGKYEIVSGERRWRAAKIAGLSRVPCIIIHDEKAAEEIALIENIQRQDLHPLELMSAFQSLLDKKICSSTQEIATKLGISKSSVVETLSLNNLPEATRKVLLKEGIKARKVLRELVKTNEDSHTKVIEAYKNSVVKKSRVFDSKMPSKILSIFIKDGVVYTENNKIDLLSNEEKIITKKFLEQILLQVK